MENKKPKGAPNSAPFQTNTIFQSMKRPEKMDFEDYKKARAKQNKQIRAYLKRGAEQKRAFQGIHQKLPGGQMIRQRKKYDYKL